MLFNLLSLLLTAYSYVLMAYLIMQWIMPNSKAIQYIKPICEPVLNPVSKFLYKQFPALYKLPVDISPIVVFVAISLLEKILFLIFK